MSDDLLDQDFDLNPLEDIRGVNLGGSLDRVAETGTAAYLALHAELKRKR